MESKNTLRLTLLVLTVVAGLLANYIRETSYPHQEPLAYAIAFAICAGWGVYLLFNAIRRIQKH